MFLLPPFPPFTVLTDESCKPHFYIYIQIASLALIPDKHLEPVGAVTQLLCAVQSGLMLNGSVLTSSGDMYSWQNYIDIFF